MNYFGIITFKKRVQQLGSLLQGTPGRIIVDFGQESELWFYQGTCLKLIVN